MTRAPGAAFRCGDPEPEHGGRPRQSAHGTGACRERSSGARRGPGLALTTEARGVQLPGAPLSVYDGGRG